MNGDGKCFSALRASRSAVVDGARALSKRQQMLFRLGNEAADEYSSTQRHCTASITQHLASPAFVLTRYLIIAHPMAQDPVRTLAEADKAYSSASTGFSWFGSKTEKLENAAELYIKAGAAFRVHKEYQKAGMAYEKVLVPFHCTLFSLQSLCTPL